MRLVPPLVPRGRGEGSAGASPSPSILPSFPCRLGGSSEPAPIGRGASPSPSILPSFLFFPSFPFCSPPPLVPLSPVAGFSEPALSVTKGSGFGKSQSNHTRGRILRPNRIFALIEASFWLRNQFSRKLTRLVMVGRIPRKSRLRRGFRDNRCSREARVNSGSDSGLAAVVDGGVVTDGIPNVLWDVASRFSSSRRMS